MSSPDERVPVAESVNRELKAVGGGFNHRIDSVIDSLREIVGSKNFALINLSFNFCETTIYDNKAFIENLVAVHSLYIKD